LNYLLLPEEKVYFEEALNCGMSEKLAVETSKFHCQLDKLISFSGKTKFT
jgi:hypothetical protein